MTLTEKEKKLLIAKKKAQLVVIKKKRNALFKEEERHKAKIQEFERQNKILYFNHPDKGYLGQHGTWDLNDAQKSIIEAMENVKYKLLVLTGDNQIGKTLAATIIVLAFMKGYWPWEDPFITKDKFPGRHLWKSHGFKPPIHIRWIGSGWEEHIQRVLIDEGLAPLWPSIWKVKTKKNNQGVDYKWLDEETGSYLYFMSSEQKLVKFAGSKCDIVLFDEPFPKEIWDENVARIIAKGGKIFVGATIAENDLWLYDEILDMEADHAKKSEMIFHLEARAKVNYGHGTVKSNVDNAAFLMTKEGREIRLGGSSLKRRGRVVNYTDDNIVERVDIPPQWLIVVAVDIGVSKPHDLLYMAIDEKNRNYFCFEEEIRGDGVKIGESIIRKARKFGLRLFQVIIDPLAKAGQFSDQSIYGQLESYLFKFGIELSAGSKQKDDGIIMLNKGFEKDVNGYPMYYIFEDMYKTKAQMKIRYDKEGKPPKKNDDQFENAYRLALLDIEFFDLDEEDEEGDKSGEIVKRNKFTGY